MSIIKNYLIQNKVTHTFTTCQWPFGDPQEKSFYFCGLKPVYGKPYCEEHCKIAYVDEKDIKKAKVTIKQEKIAA